MVATPLPIRQPNTTVKLAPQEPVREIGNVFWRVITLMDSVKLDEVVMLSKIVLSDGFWRMLVEETEQLNFAYVMPDPRKLQSASSSQRRCKWAGPKARRTSALPPKRQGISSKDWWQTKWNYLRTAWMNICASPNQQSAANLIPQAMERMSMLMILSEQPSKIRTAHSLAT
jgi:hypothetical protein